MNSETLLGSESVSEGGTPGAGAAPAAEGVQEGGAGQKPAAPEGGAAQQGQDAESPPEGEEGKGDEGPPETYEDFTMPEGVEVDAAMSEELKTLAKAKGWTQATAQAVADIGAKMAQQRSDRLASKSSRHIPDRASRRDRHMRSPSRRAGGGMTEMTERMGNRLCRPLCRRNPLFSAFPAQSARPRQGIL